MRTLGDRNLRVFTSLHEVVLSFVDRHLRRLRRHVAYGTVAGIENFMHIALAIGGTLRAQIQRLALGLDGLARCMTPEEWGLYREQADAYLEKLRDLVFCTSREYLPKMLENYGRAKVRVRVEPDIEAFERVWRDVRDSRDMIEDLRRTRLRVRTERGLDVEPQYNEKVNLMSERLWTGFSEEVEGEAWVFRSLIEG